MTPEQSQLAHFLYKPALMPGPGVVTSWSGFWLALRDARVTAGRNADTGAIVNPDPPTKWLGAVGYMVLLDQLGTAVHRPSVPTTGAPILRTLEAFTNLSDADRKVVYALRCALAHDFSLVNKGGAGDHLFRLVWDPTSPLIAHPATAWDGDYAHAATSDDTVVNLRQLIEVSEQVVAEVFNAHAKGDLALLVPVNEAEHRYFVTIA